VRCAHPLFQSFPVAGAQRSVTLTARFGLLWSALLCFALLFCIGGKRVGKEARAEKARRHQEKAMLLDAMLLDAMLLDA